MIYTQRRSQPLYQNQTTHTLAKEIASHPIILGIATIINDCNIQKTRQKSPITLHIHRLSFERLTSKHTLQINKSIKYPFAPDVFSYLTTSYSSCLLKLQRTKHIKHQNLKKQKITNQIIYIYSKTSEIERFRSRTIAHWVV